MYVEGNRSMIVLKIIIAICLFTGIFSFFWYLQKTKIIEKGLTAARCILRPSAVANAF